MGQKIKMFVDRSSLSKKAFAEEMHISTSKLDRWFKDEGQPPDFREMTYLAGRFGVSLDYFAHDEIAAEFPFRHLTPLEHKLLDMAQLLDGQEALTRLITPREPKIPLDKPRYGNRREGEGE